MSNCPTLRSTALESDSTPDTACQLSPTQLVEESPVEETTSNILPPSPNSSSTSLSLSKGSQTRMA